MVLLRHLASQYPAGSWSEMPCGPSWQSGPHPDGLRLDDGRQPRADPFGLDSDFFGSGGRYPQLRTLAARCAGRP